MAMLARMQAWVEAAAPLQWVFIVRNTDAARSLWHARHRNRRAVVPLRVAAAGKVCHGRIKAQAKPGRNRPTGGVRNRAGPLPIAGVRSSSLIVIWFELKSLRCWAESRGPSGRRFAGQIEAADKERTGCNRRRRDHRPAPCVGPMKPFSNNHEVVRKHMRA
jgi:hypothetical protein